MVHIIRRESNAMKKSTRSLITLVLTMAAFMNFLIADEGMYPISEIHKLNLRAKGFKIDPKELYNPKGVSLIDAIVQVGGCTGSFVSNEGLVISNHHCAFGAVQAASTKEKDYITDGLLARTREEEIPAKGLTVRITESYRDVSKDVLAAVTDKMELAERTKAIEKKIREIVTETEKANPGKRAEVSEMFAGRTYVLFVYASLRDIRLVYVPPRSIGEFAGENDNWVWPRHTGDFSFMRAYVGPDGKPADYAAGNVPYRPKKFLKVNPSGVEDGDFVFILGYPGRTFRHRTSHYLSYEELQRMPFVADLYEWQINTMEQLGAKDRAVAIKHDARIKGLANTMKNYRGKLKGLGRLHLADTKREEEKLLQQFIEADVQRKAAYGTVLNEIGGVYEEMGERAQSEMILDALRSSSTMLNAGYFVFEAARELQKPDAERLAQYTERNFANNKRNVLQSLDNFYDPTDRAFLKYILMKAARLPADQRIPAVDDILKGGDAEAAIDRFIDTAFVKSRLSDSKFLLDALTKDPEGIDKLEDPLIAFAKALYPTYQKLRETRQRREGALSKLSALLVDVKEQYQKKGFIPDANSTLRLTFGNIRGYSPSDATYYSPFTSLTGVLEKTTDRPPYDTPKKVVELAKAKDFGRFRSKKSNDVPVAILYNLDTTGGNSGSPVLNARGELVGVNFDRAYEATINDYAWSESYSRSIAVDIRYVLWVTQKVAGADHLLKEMGVQ
jgi:hypothetical protein